MKPSYALPAVLLLAVRPGGAADPPKAAAPVVLVTTDYRVLDGAVPAGDGGYRVGTQVVPAAQVRAAGESRADAFGRLAAARPAAVAAPATRRLFAAGAQPVLGNLCASCHAGPGPAGGFRLARVAEGYADPEAVAENLHSALGFVSRADPADSPLLRMARTPHGGQERAALPGPGHPAYRALAEWVAAAAGGR